MIRSFPFNSAPMAITMGDPAGIGPEIVAKFADEKEPSATPFIVIGDVGIMERATRIVGANLVVHELGDGLMPSARDRVLHVLQAGPRLCADLAFGQVNARAGKAAYLAIETAFELAMAGKVAGIVTAPIHKEALHTAGYHHPGHTEILADLSRTKDFAMLLVNDDLRVLLVTIHVPLEEAIRSITVATELRAIRLAVAACHDFGIEHPRIAVAGLNPHAGENGMFGRQDLDIIAPAVAAARVERIDASGPWPGDTVFMRARRGEFDMVVAQYHDQGLIPVKYLGLDRGVNITVGLPFVRTSVDHGTAFDLAGSGRAEHTSLACAFEQATAITAARRQRLSVAWQSCERREPTFIFMLTRDDATVVDARDRVAEVLAAGIRHVGFKDVGLPLDELRALAGAIRTGGAKVYLEVVSLDEQSESDSARVAVALGVDVLMGGTRPEVVLPTIKGTAIKYYPFPGRIVGHPSVLAGTAEEIVASARRLAAFDGVHGLDLLAYRFQGDVPGLIAKVCASVRKPVIVAGSIDRAERMTAVIDGGAAGFTIGTAALDGRFPAVAWGLPAQLDSIASILADARSAATQRRTICPTKEHIMPTLKKTTLSEAFATFTDTWSPRVGGDINDFQIKLAKFEGAFHWHHHEHEDELFLVVSGALRMRLHEADGGDIMLGAGEYLIVPHGVEHCPTAEPTCEVVLLERNTTLNTGNVENGRTVRKLAHV